MSDAHDDRVASLIRELSGYLARSEIPRAEKLRALGLLVALFAEDDVDFSELGLT